MTVSLRISTLTNWVLQNTRMADLLRSVEREDAPLSLFFEDLSIYYDASAPYAFFRASWVTLLRHLKALFACEPFIDLPRSVPD